jgi:RNA polymerase sigma factor (sigma-70 family)
VTRAPPVHLAVNSPPTAPDPTPAANHFRWFSEEVQPHDGQLKAYLHGAFPSVRDVDDVMQESYLRIWKARAREPIASTKAFLFKIARRVALDFVRKRRNSPLESVGDFDGLRVITDSRDVAETISLEEKIRLLAEALTTLPPRCRHIIMLCKFEGKLRREAAAELGISEKTVDEQLSRGVSRIEDFLRQRGVDGFHGP